MNYAQTNNIRKNHPARTKKTKAVAQSAQRVCPLDAKTQRRERNSERQAQVSACGDASDGFLRTCFLPKLQEVKTVQASEKTSKMQKDFYRSLCSLAKHYNLVPMPTQSFEYPYNMALALWDIEEKLKQNVLNCPELRLLQDGKRTYFISEEKYNTGTTLYYIPVEPLYHMARTPKHRRNAQLLFSVCSYLYHIADIPYYRQQDSYLYWLYEMHRDWMEQDDETQEMQTDTKEFDKAEFIGNVMEQKFFNRINLEFFEKRLNAFKSRDTFDKQCRETACKAFALLAQYPQESIFRNAPIKEEDSNESETETIGMEKYISFICNTTGWLYESIAEGINNEFNEYTNMDEPTIFKCFNGADLTGNSLDFETRLFALLDDLCELLYNYKPPENE
jgi:hypothetical protein